MVCHECVITSRPCINFLYQKSNLVKGLELTTFHTLNVNITSSSNQCDHFWQNFTSKLLWVYLVFVNILTNYGNFCNCCKRTHSEQKIHRDRSIHIERACSWVCTLCLLDKFKLVFLYYRFNISRIRKTVL